MTHASALPSPTQRRRWWPHLRRAATIAFVLLVVALLVTQARTIEWSEVGEALRAYPARTLWIAAALAVLSHSIYSSFDLIGKQWTGHEVPARHVVPLTFVCYAFNLNLGSLVGGFALRYRLYSRQGLGANTVTRVLGLSLVTNWLGYLLLAGLLFASEWVTPPDDWKIGAVALKSLGFGLLTTAAAYVLACAFSPRRSLSLRSHRFELPSGRMALWQMTVSAANWATMGAIVFVLLKGDVAYPLVLGSLLIAAMAGVLTHVPAGLGVLEAVFIALLGSLVPEGQLLGALLAYRAMYYVAPLIIATILYFTIEARPRVARALPAPR